MKQYLEACKAVSTHGVAGEVKVELWCDDAAFLSRFGHLYRGEAGQGPLELIHVRPHKNMALLTFAGAGYVLIQRGAVNAGYAVIPMLFALCFTQTYRRMKSDEHE